ncbi:Angiopoietin-2 [Liparis tanakae]|uniref:Angiopoietin-2 n=1 Tax=Liparis tanakae TaxID=230148 RepID=A0A4Z2GSR1_9TELE|nr:Angiopoietin-2 [Liparis tanakae]
MWIFESGFGDPAGEFWLGNEFVSRLTIKRSYQLRIQLSDWEGNSEFSQYDQFSLQGEAQNYRIHLKGFSGTAGKISSIGQPGSDFSTKDADNDKCVCKCSQLTTGGKKHFNLCSLGKHKYRDLSRTNSHPHEKSRHLPQTSPRAF